MMTEFFRENRKYEIFLHIPLIVGKSVVYHSVERETGREFEILIEKIIASPSPQ